MYIKALGYLAVQMHLPQPWTSKRVPYVEYDILFRAGSSYPFAKFVSAVWRVADQNPRYSLVLLALLSPCFRNTTQDVECDSRLQLVAEDVYLPIFVMTVRAINTKILGGRKT